MLISRAKAEEAANILVTAVEKSVDTEALELLRSRTLDIWNEGQVSNIYKVAARATHPDAGGTAEAFARVDWAKHVLLKWIAQDNSARPPEHKTRKCGNCNGAGYIQTMIGFKMGPRKQCQPCRGTGDADFEPDEGEAR